AMLITGNLTNAGNVRLTGPAGQQAAGDTLTVTGNYVGANGNLILDTVLGSDASPTDLLVVGGNTSGFTGITVNNVGGLGALTTGDGIMVVDVAGVSAANAFALNNSLTAGAFNYNLFHNGLLNPADGDWYLRSSARGIVPPAMVIPYMGNKASLMMLGGLQERLGIRGIEMDDGGAWIRVVGNAGEQTHQSNIGDFSGHNDSFAIQAGVDIHTTANGTRFGAYAGRTQSITHMFDLQVDPTSEVGRAKVDGFAVGGYATHYGDNYYWDAVLQYSSLDAEASGDGDSFETDSKNWLASFEFGRSFEFGNNNALEPQVQVIAGKGNTDDASDGVASYVYGDEDVLAARLGVRWTHAKDQGTVKGSYVPYVKLNVWRNFGDDAQVAVGVTDISTERNDTWVEVGAGFSVLTRNNWA
ncbi:MAG: autotransporter outer membrane beta-barrel domain-containing protein, partial [Arenimonas sp.]